MFARVTLFEIDTLRTSLDEAMDLFQERVLPRLRAQPGCQGVMVMQSPEGKGQLLSFWETEAAADAGLQSGFYDEQVAEFTMFLKQPPGREHYEVTFVELGQGFKASQNAGA
jgi:quinol monooxygenase YgiN